METIFVGLDVSKGYADVAIEDAGGRRRPGGGRYDDTLVGHQRLRSCLEAFASREPVEFKVGFEDTGGLERNWNRFLRNLGDLRISVFKLNPLAVKHFLSVDLHRKIDDPKSARGIVAYLRSGLCQTDTSTDPAEEGVLILYRHCCRRIKHCSRLQNELHALLPAVHPQLVRYTRSGLPDWLLRVLTQYPTTATLSTASAADVDLVADCRRIRGEDVVASAGTAVASLNDELTGLTISGLAEDILKLRRQTEMLREKIGDQLNGNETVRILISIPGIGLWTACVLRLELGTFEKFRSAGAMIGFAGTDPTLHRSGDFQGRSRISRRGRSRIRGSLYTSAMIAAMYNPAIRPFYERLVGQGKAKKLALVACMNKLLRIAYACVTKKQVFNSNLAAAQADGAGKAAAVPVAAVPAAAKKRGRYSTIEAPVSRREAKRRRDALSQKAEALKARDPDADAFGGHHTMQCQPGQDGKPLHRVS